MPINFFIELFISTAIRSIFRITQLAHAIRFFVSYSFIRTYFNNKKNNLNNITIVLHISI